MTDMLNAASSTFANLHNHLRWLALIDKIGDLRGDEFTQRQ
jgi:hypothetical protein